MSKKTEYLPLSGRKMPRFGGIKTFFRLPIVDPEQESLKDLDVALFGVPFDGAVSYRPGARFAPSKIREVSSLGRGYHLSRDLTVFDALNVADCGDASVVPMSTEKTYQLIEDFDQNILKSCPHFIASGGDHSTTLAHLRALKKKLGKKLSLIHFDAHLDTYPAAWGCEYHHGAFVRHAVEEELIDPKTSLQIGIRGPLAGQSDLEFNEKHQLKVLTVDEIREKGLSKVIESLPEFTEEAFLSFDVDCLDPSCVPGTGTPVPGGLTSYEVQKILQALKCDKLLAADVVELCPPFDQSDISALVAVDVIFEILCLFRKQAS